MMLQIINKFNVIWIVQILIGPVKTERRIVGGNEAKPRKDNFKIFPKFSFVKNVHFLTFPACFYIPIFFSIRILIVLKIRYEKPQGTS